MSEAARDVMTRLRASLLWFWNIATRPSTHLSLAFLALGGFVFGIMFWGAFNTALEVTNTEKFCTGCHEMRDNVYQELQRTVHFSNRSGVRATCPDCHVPHNWTDKIARKMQASEEVWGKIFGTIATREKFLNHRLELAKHEWTRMAANDSLECRNCHSAVAMDFSRQTNRAAAIHTKFLVSGQRTCIDCHKGIAHQLPDMTGIEPGWLAPPEERDRGSSIESLRSYATSIHR
jgi:cytochrome c-type protein NapC